MGFLLSCLLVGQVPQIEAPNMVNGIRSILPEVESDHITAILVSDDTLWYTHEGMPPQYQQGTGGNADGPGTQFISTFRNVAAFPDRSGGNANVLFPWGTVAGGTHRARGTRSFKAIHLPRDEMGEILPVVVHDWDIERNFSNSTRNGVGWRFPVGTVFLEVLTMQGPDENPSGRRPEYVYEIRVRERERTQWAMSVYRPFRTAQEFTEDARRRRPNRSGQMEVALQGIEDGKYVQRYTLQDTFRNRHAFRVRGYVQTLPDIQDVSLIKEQLINTKFKESLGEVWVEDGEGNRVVAPTTKAQFHVVPANYDGAFMGFSSESCMRCHQDTLKAARPFDRGLEWYGQVRGSDGILSFRPTGNNGLNRTLAGAGMVANFNPRIHTKQHYTTIRGLQ